MIHVLFPPEVSPEHRGATFFLAAEEVVARRYARGGNGPYFFMWQVDPTVVCGRHQWVGTEVDIPYCRSHGINIVRRRSGGGAIYADRNNVMFSYIAAGAGVMTTFAEYSGLVARFLSGLGLDASATSRNDILIGDRKVSGSAFYHLPGANIAHGTMLYDTDPEAMAKALTPSRAKLLSKGVTSVKSRVTTIVSHLPELGLDEFKRLAVETLTDSSIMLTGADMEAILEAEMEYLDPSWQRFDAVAGSATRRLTRRLEGVGQFEVDLELDGDVISSLTIGGDFFATGPLEEVCDSLRGVRLSAGAVRDALPDEMPVAGLTPDAFTDLICNN